MDKCQQQGTKVIQVFRFKPTLKEEEVTLFKENVAVGGNSKLLCGFSSFLDSIGLLYILDKVSKLCGMRLGLKLSVQE